MPDPGPSTPANQSVSGHFYVVACRNQVRDPANRPRNVRNGEYGAREEKREKEAGKLGCLDRRRLVRDSSSDHRAETHIRKKIDKRTYQKRRGIARKPQTKEPKRQYQTEKPFGQRYQNVGRDFPKQIFVRRNTGDVYLKDRFLLALPRHC